MYNSVIKSTLGHFACPFVRFKPGIETAAIVVGAVATAASVGSAVANNVQANKAKHAQQDENERSREWSEDMWNKENEYNKPSNQVSRLMDAGLNPNLFGGDNTAGSVQSPTPMETGEPTESPLSSISTALMGLFNNMFSASARKTNAEASLTEAQAQDQKSRNAYWEYVAKNVGDSKKSANFFSGLFDNDGNFNLDWMPPSAEQNSVRYLSSDGKYFNSPEDFDKYFQRKAPKDQYELWRKYYNSGTYGSFLSSEIVKGKDYKGFNSRIHYEETQKLKDTILQNTKRNADKMSFEDLMSTIKSRDPEYYDAMSGITKEQFKILKQKALQAVNETSISGHKVNLADYQQQLAHETLEQLKADKEFNFASLVSKVPEGDIIGLIGAFFKALFYRAATSGHMKFGRLVI